MSNWLNYDKLEHLKIVTNVHQYKKTTEDENFVFWINTHNPIKKQSNQDWNTPTHLKKNGPDIKVPLIFGFFFMIFHLCFYNWLWVKWVCTHIWNSSDDIGQYHPRFLKYLWMLLPNEMHIKLTSLIICSINDNFTNTPSTSSPERKETVLYIAHLIILCTSTKTSIYCKFMDKIFNLF